MLPTLKPRYDAVVSSIDQQKQTALEQDAQLAGTEDTDLKKLIASRGLEANTGDAYFNTENNKQQTQQNTRANSVGQNFESLKSDVRSEQAQNESTIKSAIATLLTQKGTAKQAQANWQATFDFTKSEAAADRAVQLRQMALSEAKTGNSKLDSDISTMVGNAYAGGFGSNNGIREVIASQLAAKYPGQESKIKTQIEKFLPNGWEGKIYKTSGPAQPTKEIGDWVYFDDGTRENQVTGEVQKQG